MIQIPPVLTRVYLDFLKQNSCMTALEVFKLMDLIWDLFFDLVMVLECRVVNPKMSKLSTRLTCML